MNIKTNLLAPLCLAGATLLSSNQAMAEDTANPFYAPFNTVHGTAPFSKINNSQWIDAVDRGIKLAQQEVDVVKVMGGLLQEKTAGLLLVPVPLVVVVA